MQLFVYGSLLRGMSLSSYMEGTIFLGPAYVKADLFFLGFYPGIIHGDQQVYGELYEVDDEQLPIIDEVEDYIELDNERSAYLRRPIEAYRLSDGQKVKSQAYFYNRSPEGKPRIHCGDYRIYMNSQQSETTWLIGYARNMSSEKIGTLLGYIPEYKVGYIEGFERVYNVKTGVNGNAYANLEFKGGVQKCSAVAWKITYDQLSKFDEVENVPDNYSRISLPFKTVDGEQIHAQTYFANIKRLSANLHPDPVYLKQVHSGLKEHGFMNSLD